MQYSTIDELLKVAEKNNISISEVVIQVEVEESELPREEVVAKMKESLVVMRDAIEKGRNSRIKSSGGLVGEEALKMAEYSKDKPERLFMAAITDALAVAEVNAGMGKIVAGPTAGASGIVPAVVVSVGEKLNLSDLDMVKGLFTAAGLGDVVSHTATLAGAAGGCQAECGVGSAMAAGAAVELMGGSPEMAVNAFALALKNLLGLVCDPVAGLVEVPCVKRNGFAASHALTAALMALSGIKSVIPPDEVILAMTDVGSQMPSTLRETAKGGLAITPTGREIKNKLENKE
ncbi:MULTISPECIES: L-serine ammonia-lyase, iron-sulfur-dependent, subunit alpha [unclassified Halanaerobium]|uniref:L-serine ammonia-lyase, iron-sulfur-dependent, subunit alpha n=1 Tax=unclassified Halanaerobium TaxID=2641197 RepID=UPI000DF13739|nr:MULTISPECIES: L-serine ammonia-lyase, iron-sulfur-dependent, subunit alpha [unclassified Halanaerobium]RCW43805.1 L-serine dehydratase [Halanaerobium sp. MA284_MarDTE_T2]RCW80506.1 L-serine dehydratase [Halanaerobium sp. DL-01]